MVQFLVPIIILCIIALQIYFFVKNLNRMHEFRDIFESNETWEISKDEDTGFVNGIIGNGNSIFVAIRQSINKYLRNNAGSVIDFSLLKDAVDRHCDSVEDDISSQMPVPLYCGLAGTMLGVIIGLSSLLYTGSVTSLLGASKNKQQTELVAQQQTENSITEEEKEKQDEANTQAAADGVNDLLTGVAWAMIASICGIGLTTANSLKFKKCKLQEESGKNEFLAWMQSKLLPELPSDTSDALNKLVKNLNRFNNTFKQNTSDLGETLSKVNESYKIQADIIQAVHDMDVMKMAKANVKVLEQLQSCTDELEQFQQYLNSINGYTEAIQHFTELFNSESDRLHVLEEIRDFFTRHKAEIAKNITDEDVALKKALKNLENTSIENVDELKKNLTTQSEAFKTTNRELLETLTQQMNAFPKINKNLEEISKIPAALEKLAKKIEQSNDNVVKQVQLKLNTLSMSGASHEETSARVLSPGMKLLIWVVGIVIIFASLFISVMSFKSWQNTRTIQQKLLEDNTTEVIDSVEASPVKVDSTAIKAKPEKPDTAQVFQ
jgi:Na+-transporting methylmalonyl-CoA/oxaloacetate decarboxylase gamma subunit